MWRWKGDAVCVHACKQVDTCACMHKRVWVTLTVMVLTGEKGQHRNGHGNSGGDLGEGDEDGGQGSCHLVLHLQGADPQGGDAHLGHPRHQAKLKTLHHLVLHANSQHQHFTYSVSGFLCVGFFKKKSPQAGLHC